MISAFIFSASQSSGMAFALLLAVISILLDGFCVALTASGD